MPEECAFGMLTTEGLNLQIQIDHELLQQLHLYLVANQSNITSETTLATTYAWIINNCLKINKSIKHSIIHSTN